MRKTNKVQLAVHQPDYLPWLAYFDQMKRVDFFVFLDCAEYGWAHGFHNRNKIKINPGKWSYLTIPLGRGIGRKQIKDIMLPEDKSWQEQHFKSISTAYARASHFKDHKDFFKKIYRSDFKLLADFNIEIIKYLKDAFGFKTKLLRESELSIDHSLVGTKRVVAILKELKANHYLSGPSGKTYLDLAQFKKEEIEIEFQDYQPPVYNQIFGDFIPGLSAIDLLFNEGEKAGDII